MNGYKLPWVHMRLEHLQSGDAVTSCRRLAQLQIDMLPVAFTLAAMCTDPDAGSSHACLSAWSSAGRAQRGRVDCAVRGSASHAALECIIHVCCRASCAGTR